MGLKEWLTHWAQPSSLLLRQGLSLNPEFIDRLGWLASNCRGSPVSASSVLWSQDSSAVSAFVMGAVIGIHIFMLTQAFHHLSHLHRFPGQVLTPSCWVSLQESLYFLDLWGYEGFFFCNVYMIIHQLNYSHIIVGRAIWTDAGECL